MSKVRERRGFVLANLALELAAEGKPIDTACAGEAIADLTSAIVQLVTLHAQPRQLIESVVMLLDGANVDKAPKP